MKTADKLHFEHKEITSQASEKTEQENNPSSVPGTWVVVLQVVLWPSHMFQSPWAQPCTNKQINVIAKKLKSNLNRIGKS